MLRIERSYTYLAAGLLRVITLFICTYHVLHVLKTRDVANLAIWSSCYLG